MNSHFNIYKIYIINTLRYYSIEQRIAGLISERKEATQNFYTFVIDLNVNK